MDTLIITEKMSSSSTTQSSLKIDKSQILKHTLEFTTEDQVEINNWHTSLLSTSTQAPPPAYSEPIELNTPGVVNKGTGAGGSNTNANGKPFEEKTNNEPRLLELGYIKHTYFSKSTKKHDYYLSKTFEDKTIVFLLQNGLKRYMKYKYNITDICRCPDEAYIIEYNNGRKVIKILEKKHQTHEGSVETKLWAGPSLKREYELILGDEFEVVYGFCVSDFLKYKLLSNEKKYIILNIIFTESNIVVLFGDDEYNYFNTLDIWINNSL